MVKKANNNRLRLKNVLTESLVVDDFQIYNLIMEFIKSHKAFIAAGTALAAGIGMLLYIYHHTATCDPTRVNKKSLFLRFMSQTL